MHRRRLLTVAGLGTAVTLAGCSSREDDEEPPEEPDDEGELRVATVPWMVRGAEPASEWVRERFEAIEDDAELVFTVPDAGFELYRRRHREELAIDADVYLGVTAADLVTLEAELDAERPLFDRLDRAGIAGTDRLREEHAFEAHDEWVLPVAADYPALVYDETAIESPEAFADLLDPAVADRLLVPDPRTSQTGLSFLTWTVTALGESTAFDFWEALGETDAQVVDRWAETYYDDYAEGAGDAIVGYSTAGLVATHNEWDRSRHRVTFLEGSTVRERFGVGVFADTARTELATRFVEFLLEPETQMAIALRAGRHPSVEETALDLDERFTAHVRTPVEPTTVSTAALATHREDWLAAWEQAIDP